jgi:hypothetical protein
MAKELPVAVNQSRHGPQASPSTLNTGLHQVLAGNLGKRTGQQPPAINHQTLDYPLPASFSSDSAPNHMIAAKKVSRLGLVFLTASVENQFWQRFHLQSDG